jgi:hypothetical protein
VKKLAQLIVTLRLELAKLKEGGGVDTYIYKLLERIIMPTLDDVVVAATSQIVSQAAQIVALNAQVGSLTAQLATAQAGNAPPALGLDTNSVTDVNGLGAVLTPPIAPVNGTPLAAASAGSATTLSVSAPSTAAVGTPIQVTVTAQNAAGATATGYTGTVTLGSTDGAATLPPGAALVNGVGTFTVTLNTVGTQTITAADNSTPSLGGSSAPITVS